MADSTISGLTPVSSVNNSDLFVLEQSSEAKKMTAGQLLQFSSANIVTASATQLPSTDPPTATFDTTTKNIALGIPAGAAGAPGVSPTITITDIPGGHRITIVSAGGTSSCDVMNGEGSPGTSTPLMDGTAAVGVAESFSREDHIHPTDTSRAASSHTHNASDISSGALPISRGGTGGTNATEARAELDVPEKIHAYQHATNGDDPVTPASIGAMAVWKQIWTNPNPSSPYNGGYFDYDLSGYDFVYATFATGSRRGSILIPIDGNDYIVTYGIQSTSNNYYYKRPMSASSTRVTFGQGLQNTTEGGTYAIPQDVYAIKGLII